MRSLVILALLALSCFLVDARRLGDTSSKLKDDTEEEEIEPTDGTDGGDGGGGMPPSSCDADLVSTGGNIRERVIGYIDAGTCEDVCPIPTECEEDAQSYFEDFIYKGKRVIIYAQAPDHDAETNMLSYENINRRCTRWQYVTMDVDVKKTKDTSTAPSTYLDTTMVFLNGVAGYNPWSTPLGNIAMHDEVQTLDECGGHSAFFNTYHYHSIPLCDMAKKSTSLAGALDPSKCKQVAWMLDGVPVYGLCYEHKRSKTQFKSCYKVNDESTLVTKEHITLGEFEVAPEQSDYTWSQADYDAGLCNLDAAQGAIHPKTGKYSYFLTLEYPWMPLYYYGEGADQVLTSGSPSTPCSAN